MANVNTNNPIVLYPIFTENVGFMSDDMAENDGMLCDMIEVNSLLAAIELAEDNGIAIPKIKAVAFDDPYFGPAIKAELMGPVSNDFDKLFNDILNGDNSIINNRTVDGNITHVNPNDSYDMYTYDIGTTLMMINSHNR
jgi:hypothetical protein